MKIIKKLGILLLFTLCVGFIFSDATFFKEKVSIDNSLSTTNNPVIEGTTNTELATKPAINNTTSPTKQLKVLVINQDPHLDFVDMPLSSFYSSDWRFADSWRQERYRDFQTIVPEYLNNLNYMSEGKVQATIVGYENFNEFPRYNKPITLSDNSTSDQLDIDTFKEIFVQTEKIGFGFFAETIYTPKWQGWNQTEYGQQFNNFTYGDYDYTQILYDYIENGKNLIQRRVAGEFDMVWLVDYQLTWNYESVIVGNSGYFCNGSTINAPCDNFMIMAVSPIFSETYLECLAHAAESSIGKAFNNSHISTPPAVHTQEQFDAQNHWNQYLQRDWIGEYDSNGNYISSTELSPSFAVAGNVHYAPNSLKDYQWDNMNTTSDSMYNDFRNNYPNLTGNRTYISETSWEGLNQDFDIDNNLSHKIWWFQGMPNVPGRDKDGFSNNWWDYILGLDFITSVNNPTLVRNYYVGDTITDITFNITYNSTATSTYNLNVICPNTRIVDANHSVELTDSKQLVAVKSGFVETYTKLDRVSETPAYLQINDRYTLYYSANGGSGSITSEALNGDTFVTKDNDDGIYKLGYKIVGWQVENTEYILNPDFEYNVEDFVNEAGLELGDTVTLNAIWESIFNDVTLDGNVATGYDSGLEHIYPQVETSFYGTTFQLVDSINYLSGTTTSPRVYSKEGYTFLGYASTPDAKVANYLSYNTNTQTFSVVKPWDKGNGTCTLYAIFKKNITLTLKSINGSSQTNIRQNRLIGSIYNAETNAEINFSEITPGNYIGWEFIGWTEGVENNSPLLTQTSISLTADKTLYAKYQKIITITYEEQGGNALSDVSQTFIHNTYISTDALPKITQTFATPTYNNHTFIAWNTKIDGTGTSYNTTTVQNVNASIVLYAQWRGVLAKITLSSSLGEINSGFSTVYVEYGTKNFFSTNNYDNTNAITFTSGTQSFACYDYGTYTFLGYSTELNSTTANVITFNGSEFNVLQNSTFNSNTTIYAIFSKSITITFKDYKFEVKNTNFTETRTIYNAQTSCTFTVPTAFNRNGWNLRGWSLSQNANGDLYTQNTITITDTTTVYATYTKTVTVTYNANGGNSLSNSTGTAYCSASGRNQNATISLKTATRTGYNFYYWDTNSEGTGSQYFVENTNAFSEDIELFAQWKGILYQVTIDFNTGVASTNGVSSFFAEYNTMNFYLAETGFDSIYMTAGEINSINCPTKETYSFLGFGTTNTSTTADFISYNSSTNEFTIINNYTTASAKTIYAIYKKTITLNFWDFEGVSQRIRTVSKNIYNAQTTASFDMITARILSYGYGSWEFNCWSESKEPTGSAIYDGYSISSNTSIYAIYKKQIQLQYDTTGGNNLSPSYGNAYYNSSAQKPVLYPTIELRTPTRNNYNFINWNTSADGQGESYSGSGVFGDPRNIISLFAQWRGVLIPVQLNANNGIAGVGLTSFYAEYNSKNFFTTNSLDYDSKITNFTAPSESTFNLPSKQTYTFIGYSLTQNDTETTFLKFEDNTFTPTNNFNQTTSTMCYAVYKKVLTITYVDYYENSKSQRTSQKTIYNSETQATFTLFEIQEYTNWSAIGWTETQEAQGTLLTQPTLTISADKTLFARYLKVITIDYDENGGVVIENETDTIYFNSFGSFDYPQILLHSTTKIGYTFKNWTDKNSMTVYSNLASPYEFTKNVFLMATWEAHSFTIVYHENLGTGEMTNSTAYYNQEIQLKNNTFTRAGYLFNGWSKTNNGEVIYQNNYEISVEDVNEYLVSEEVGNGGTLNLYVIWKYENYTLSLATSNALWGKVGFVSNAQSTQISNPTINIDSVTNIYAVCTTGYHFVEWQVITENVEPIFAEQTNAFTTISNVRTNMSVKAIFVPTIINTTVYSQISVYEPSLLGGSVTANAMYYNQTTAETFDNTLTDNTIKVAYDTTLILGQTTNENFTFIGWFNSQNSTTALTTESDFTINNLTQQNTYYARYIYKTISITINSQRDTLAYSTEGGSANAQCYYYNAVTGVKTLNELNQATNGTLLIAYGESVTITPVENAGYTPVAIFNTTGRVLNSTLVFTSGESIIIAESILTARFTYKTYTLNFYAETDTEMQTPILTKNVTYKSEIGALESGTLPVGYSLENWLIDGEIITFATIWEFTTDKKAIRTIIADNFYITFNSNGSSDSMEKQTATYDSQIILKTNTLTRKGYTFAGWATTIDGSIVYDNEDNLTKEQINAMYSTNGVGKNRNYTLFAVWNLIDYTLSLSIKNASDFGYVGFLQVPSTTTDTKIVQITSNTNVFALSKNGYKFISWNLVSGEAQIVNPTASSCLIKNVYGDTVIEAFFVPVTINVTIYTQLSTSTFNSICGTVEASGQYYNQSNGELTDSVFTNNILGIAKGSSLTTTAQTLENFVFVGWFNSQTSEVNLSNQTTFFIENVNLATTYFARFIPKTLEIDLSTQLDSDTTNTTCGNLSLNGFYYDSEKGLKQLVNPSNIKSGTYFIAYNTAFTISQNSDDDYTFIKYTLERGTVNLVDGTLSTASFTALETNATILAHYVPATIDLTIYTQIAQGAQNATCGTIIVNGNYYNQTTGEKETSAYADTKTGIAKWNNVTLQATRLDYYVFVGWYETQNSLTKIVEGDSYSFKVLTPTTLYARFIPATLTITINVQLNNEISTEPGTVSASSIYYETENGTQQQDKKDLVQNTTLKVACASGVTLSNTAFTGYTFAGYYNTTIKLDSSTIYGTNDILNRDSKISARFTANTYTLTFKDSEYSNDISGTLQVVYNQKISKNGVLPNPKNTALDFMYWTINNQQITSDTIWLFTEDKTSIAKWNAKIFEITFALGQGTKIQGKEKVYIEYLSNVFHIAKDKDSQVVSNTVGYNSFAVPKLDTYEFIGYASKATMKTPDYIAFNNGVFEVKLIEFNDTKISTLYAIYKKDLVLTYSYSNSNNEGVTEQETKTIYSPTDNAYFTLKDIKDSKYSKNGWNALGWSKVNEDTTINENDIINANQVIDFKYQISQNETLYAKYYKEITINLTDAEGKITTKTEKLYSSSTGNLTYPKYTLPTPEKKGYDFLYWTLNADGSGPQYKAGANIEVKTATNQTVLYPVFKPKQLSITFYDDNNVKIRTTYASYGDKFDTNTQLPCEKESSDEKITYKFDGWYFADGKTKAGEFTVEESVGLYAHFTEQKAWFTDAELQQIIIYIIAGVGGIVLIVGSVLVTRKVKKYRKEHPKKSKPPKPPKGQNGTSGNPEEQVQNSNLPPKPAPPQNQSSNLPPKPNFAGMQSGANNSGAQQTSVNQPPPKPTMNQTSVAPPKPAVQAPPKPTIVQAPPKPNAPQQPSVQQAPPKPSAPQMPPRQNLPPKR